MDAIEKIVDSSVKGIVLDLGCGVGKKLRWLLSKDVKTVGLDISIPALKRCRDLGAMLVRGDATHLPFRDEVFGRVICTEILEHIPDVTVVIGEMVRVCRRDADVLISTPNYLNLMGVKKWLKELSCGRNNYSPWGHHVYEKGILSIFWLREIQRLMRDFVCLCYYGENFQMAWVDPIPKRGYLRHLRRLLDSYHLDKLVGWKPCLRNSPFSFLGMSFFIYLTREYMNTA